jgi:hypothetical protein
MKISRYFRGKWTRAQFNLQNTSRGGAVGLVVQRLQVDDQLEGRRPFYRQVGRFGTLQEAAQLFTISEHYTRGAAKVSRLNTVGAVLHGCQEYRSPIWKGAVAKKGRFQGGWGVPKTEGYCWRIRETRILALGLATIN